MHSTYIGHDVRPQREPDAEHGPVRPLLPRPLDDLSHVPRRTRVVEDAARDLAPGTAPAVDDQRLPFAARDACLVAMRGRSDKRSQHVAQVYLVAPAAEAMKHDEQGLGVVGP